MRTCETEDNRHAAQLLVVSWVKAESARSFRTPGDLAGTVTRQFIPTHLTGLVPGSSRLSSSSARSLIR